MDEEIEKLTKAIKLNPKSSDAYFNRGYAYAQKEKWDEAIADYDQAINLNPEDWDAYYNRGYAYSRKEKWNEAIADYDQAIKFDLENWDAYFNRGYAYSRKEKWEEAIENFNQAIKLNPQNWDAYHARGIAYIKKGKWDQAITDYDQFIKFNREKWDAYYNRGLAYSQKNEWGKAIADYDRSIKLNPKNWDAYYNRGLAYIKKEKRDQAIADYDQFIKFNPQNWGAYHNRGLAYFQKGELDQAITDYDQAIKLKPGYSNAYLSRGLAYLQKGELDQAITDYDQAITLNGKNSDAYYIRGYAYLQKEKWDEAFRDFMCAGESEPTLKSTYIYIYVASRISDATSDIDGDNKRQIIKNYLELVGLIGGIQNELFYDPQGQEVAHYTSLDKINKLVGGAHFRLYNASYMNDPEEGRIFFDVLKDIMKDIMKDTETNFETMFDEKNEKDENIPDLSPAYIGSFVKLDDSSAQESKDKLFLWRTYGRHNGKDAAGGCLIFSRDKFAENHRPQIGYMGQQASVNPTPSFPQAEGTGQLSSKPPIYEIVYPDTELLTKLNDQLSELGQCLKKIEKIIRKNIEKDDTKNQLKQLARELLDGIRFLFKARHYREEQEVRVIQLRYRSGKKRQEPDEIKADKDRIPPRFYLEAPRDFRCKELILGPMVQNLQNWKWWLEEQDVEVKQSAIKYISHD